MYLTSGYRYPTNIYCLTSVSCIKFSLFSMLKSVNFMNWKLKGMSRQVFAIYQLLAILNLQIHQAPSVEMSEIDKFLFHRLSFLSICIIALLCGFCQCFYYYLYIIVTIMYAPCNSVIHRSHFDYLEVVSGTTSLLRNPILPTTRINRPCDTRYLPR